MTAEGAETSISSLDAHFLKLRRYAELGSIRPTAAAAASVVPPSKTLRRLGLLSLWPLSGSALSEFRDLVLINYLTASKPTNDGQRSEPQPTAPGLSEGGLIVESGGGSRFAPDRGSLVRIRLAAGTLAASQATPIIEFITADVRTEILDNNEPAQAAAALADTDVLLTGVWRSGFPAAPKLRLLQERVLKTASACVAWESSASRLQRDESSQSQPNQKYALMAGRILIHYMINGGFLGAGGEANRDNNYILDHVDRLKEIPVHIVHGRYDRVCHLYQAEALARALRAVGNNEVNYFITMAGHSSLEPETDSKLCAIMNDLPPMNPFDRGGK